MDDADSREDQEQIDFPEYPPLDETGMVDLWQIEGNLTLSPTERLIRHDNFREMVRAVRRAGVKHDANRGTDSSAA